MTPFLQPPVPALPRISPSQVDKFALCERKWGWEYLDGIRPPQHRSAAAGQRVHEILEHWLRAGVPPNRDERLELDGHTYYPGLIAESGLYNLPPPGPHHDIEVDFEVPFVSGYPALWRGRIDSAYEVLTPILATFEDGRQVLDRHTSTPEILDHKTTTNLDYRKLPSDLAFDAQGNVYAHAAMHKTGAHEVNLRWVYYKSTKPYRSEVSFVKLSRKHVVEQLSLWEELARSAIEAKQRGARALEMRPNPRACDRYGGCPHRDRCKLTPGEVMVATMSGEMGLLEKVQAMRAAQANGGVPAAPPVPVANMQPVFAAPPQAAPPPPPNGNGNGRMLPAPWVVHSQDPNWLFNAQTGEFEQHTAEGIARIQARYAPPQAPPPPPPVQAAPPPPPVQAAPPAYVAPQAPPVPPLTAAQAQAWTHPAAVQAPPPPPQVAVHAAMDAMGVPKKPLDPVLRAAIEGAIRMNALDSQIIANYPDAAPYVAEIRLAVLGPQRATGINAPEGANIPPLAQPPAPPPAPPPAEKRDDSKVGDAFDAMDGKALRAFAAQHGIECEKGAREKSLRIHIRGQAQARGLVPGQAPPPMQQPTLPWPGQPAAPSPPIPQAVQQHVASTPSAPSSPSPFSAPLHQAPQVDAEIRAALDELNRVGDRLRRLIGAD